MQAAAFVVAGVAVPAVLMRIAGVDAQFGLSALAGISCAVAAALFGWLHVRWARPLRRTTEAARRYAHGQGGVRADPASGAREARFFARALNCALDRAVNDANAVAKTSAVRDAVEQIQAFGQGELAEPTAPLEGAMAPIGYALMTAQQRLRDRIDGLYRSAVAVAEGAAGMAPLIRQTAELIQEQGQTLRKLARDADHARGEALRIEPSFQSAVESMLAAQRVHAFGDPAGEVSRGVVQARQAAARTEILVDETPKIDRAFRLLSAVTGDSPPSAHELSTTIEAADHAQATLRSELVALKAELGRLAEGLASSGSAEPVVEPDASVAEPLAAFGATMARASMLSTNAVRNLAFTTERLEEIANEAGHYVEKMAAQVPRLSIAVTQVGLDAPFESALLDQLRRTKTEIEKVPPNGLTASGHRMLEEVDVAAEAAKDRLAALMKTTEATLSTLRVG